MATRKKSGKKLSGQKALGSVKSPALSMNHNEAVLRA